MAEMSAWGVRRAKAALSSGCKSHPAPLQPEATGAVMEVTKWLKPLLACHDIRMAPNVRAVLAPHVPFKLVDR
jgi:hypothetical protein